MDAATQTLGTLAVHVVTWGIARDDSDSSVPLGAFATWESAKAAVESHAQAHQSPRGFYNVLAVPLNKTVNADHVLHETKHYSRFFHDTWTWY